MTAVPSYPALVTSEGDTRLLCARGEGDSRARTSGLLGDACQVTSKDLCSSDLRLVQGDSGGPLVVEDDLTGHWALAGVVTGRQQCTVSSLSPSPAQEAWAAATGAIPASTST